MLKFGKNKNSDGSQTATPKKKGFPLIRATFAVAALGIGGAYAASHLGYEEPWNYISGGAKTVVEQGVGPFAEAVGLAYRVEPRTRHVVTHGGDFEGLGQVADPGRHFYLWVGYDDHVIYSIGQQELSIERNENGLPITTATEKGQSIENIRLDGLWHIVGDTETENGMDDSIRRLHILQGKEPGDEAGYTGTNIDTTLRRVMLNAHKDVFGEITITSIDASAILDMMTMSGASDAQSFAQMQQILDQETGEAESNLMNMRDELNTRMVRRANQILQGTELAGLIEFDQIMLTNFDFTDTYDQATEAIAQAEADFLRAQAEIQVSRAQEERQFIDARADRRAAEERALGAAAQIEEPGQAANRVFAERVRIAADNTEALEELTAYQQWGERWQGEGWAVPRTLSTGGDANTSLLLTPDLEQTAGEIAREAVATVVGTEANDDEAAAVPQIIPPVVMPQ